MPSGPDLVRVRPYLTAPAGSRCCYKIITHHASVTRYQRANREDFIALDLLFPSTLSMPPKSVPNGSAKVQTPNAEHQKPTNNLHPVIGINLGNSYASIAVYTKVSVWTRLAYGAHIINLTL